MLNNIRNVQLSRYVHLQAYDVDGLYVSWKHSHYLFVAGVLCCKMCLIMVRRQSHGYLKKS